MEREYRRKILELITKISDKRLLARIYSLTEYLYIHKDTKVGDKNA